MTVTCFMARLLLNIWLFRGKSGILFTGEKSDHASVSANHLAIDPGAIGAGEERDGSLHDQRHLVAALLHEARQLEDGMDISGAAHGYKYELQTHLRILGRHAHACKNEGSRRV